MVSRTLMIFQRFTSEMCRWPDQSFSQDVQLTYLGTAGFVFQHQQQHIVVDPFVSRPSIINTLTRPLKPNAELIRSIIPRADQVLVGHSHHDHILDAPELCHQTGAQFIGSSDACNVARAAGLPESQIRATQGHEEIACGPDCSAMGVPSAHGRVYFNRVTLPGSIPEPPKWPPRLWDLRHGQVLNWLLRLGELTIVHIDSAEFINEELQGMQADVVCLCAIGRAWRPNYVADIVRLLKPRLIIPCHWDQFWVPYHGQHRMLPGVDLPGFVREIEAEGVEVGVLPIGGKAQL